MNNTFIRIALFFLIFHVSNLSAQSNRDTSIVYAKFAIGPEFGLTGFDGFRSNDKVGLIPLNSSPLAGVVFTYSPRLGFLSFSTGLRWKQALLWRNYYVDNRSKGVVVLPVDVKMNFLRKKKIGFTLQYGLLHNFHTADYKYCQHVSKSILSYWTTRTGGSMNIKLKNHKEIRIHSFFILHGDPWTPRCNQNEWVYARGIELSVNLVKRFGLWSWN